VGDQVVSRSNQINRTKRAFDVIVASSAVLATAPLWPLIAIAIKLESRGPAFYRSPRVGQGGTLFTILKFRSMAVTKGGPGITRAGDARITRVGRVLRASKLDELPQLINVLRGDMSVVGPRPEDPQYVVRYTPRQREVLSFKPGITGAAAVAFRHEQELLEQADDPETAYVNTIMPMKLDLELSYIDSWSLLGDLRLVIQTVSSIATRAPETNTDKSDQADRGAEGHRS
jgi:lipopolysaccharide/colanic/teichoic acid biosynthesis glycosyltransferase